MSRQRRKKEEEKKRAGVVETHHHHSKQPPSRFLDSVITSIVTQPPLSLTSIITFMLIIQPPSRSPSLQFSLQFSVFLTSVGSGAPSSLSASYTLSGSGRLLAMALSAIEIATTRPGSRFLT